MELPGFALDGPVLATPYADVHVGRRLHDGAPVRVEVLRGADPARLQAAEDALRRVDGRHLVRVRQVLAQPPALVREHVPSQPLDGDPVRLVADVLDALAVLHAQGLAHGALTADDVLLDASVPLRPVVRLTGWGLAGLVATADPAEDVRAAGRLLVSLGAADAAQPLLADHPPTAAQARDLLRGTTPPVPAPPPRAPRAPRPPRDLRTPLRVAAGVLAALVVLGLGVLGGRLLAGRDSADGLPAVQGAAPPAGPYVLPAVQRPDGLVVERTWLLEQEGAVLRGTTVVRNPTLQARTAQVEEVLPPDLRDVDFVPPPDAVVVADAVVSFDVRALPPGGTTTWTWVAQLPEPLSRTALPQLAQDVEAVRAVREQRRETPAPGGPAPSPTS